jgi:hypothetical protein
MASIPKGPAPYRFLVRQWKGISDIDLAISALDRLSQKIKQLNPRVLLVPWLLDTADGMKEIHRIVVDRLR